MMTSLSSVLDVTAGLWAQLQQQQAQRMADQAQQRASSLRGEAQSAENVAQQAQQNARSLNIESSQADIDAGNAARGLAQSQSSVKVQGSLNNLHQQLTSLQDAAPTTAPASAAQPVVNTSGQTTGAVISVVA